MGRESHKKKSFKSDWGKMGNRMALKKKKC